MLIYVAKAESFGLITIAGSDQPSRIHAGNPTFLLISSIPAVLLEHPAFLALFRYNKNRCRRHFAQKSSAKTSMIAIK